MFPIIEIYGSPLDWHSFFISLGTFIGFVFGIIYYKKKAQKAISLKNLFIIVLFILIAHLGSRTTAIFEFYLTGGFENNALGFYDYFFSKQGGRWFGALAWILFFFPFVFLTVLRKERESTWELLDIMALSLCLGFCIGKIGCFASGHGCYGIPTNLPWGMYFSHGAYPSLFPVHPTPLYDTITHLCLFILLITIHHRSKFPLGTTALIGISLSAIINILIENLRNNDSILFDFSLAQIYYIIILNFSIFILYKTIHPYLFIVPK